MLTTMEAEKRDPGNEVGKVSVVTNIKSKFKIWFVVLDERAGKLAAIWRENWLLV